MVRRICLVLALALPLAAAEPTSYDRLAAAAKLWAFVKYCHPGVTATGIDWDAALAKATPKIIAATNESEFADAVELMLGELHDPLTHVVKDEMKTADSKLLL